MSALIAELGGPTVIVGNSMGAGAGVLVAAGHPELGAGLVLVGPWVRVGNAGAQTTRSRLDRRESARRGRDAAPSRTLPTVTATRADRRRGRAFPQAHRRHGRSATRSGHPRRARTHGHPRSAAVGRARGDAIAAIDHAYRAWAREHPGRYAAAQPAPAPDDTDDVAASQAVLDVVTAVLAAYNQRDDDAIDATRALRSTLHGFVTLELTRGFGLPVDLDP